MSPSQQSLVVVIFILCEKIGKLNDFLLNMLKQFLEKPTMKFQSMLVSPPKKEQSDNMVHMYQKKKK